MDRMHFFLSSKNVLKLIKIKLNPPKTQPLSISGQTLSTESTDSLLHFKRRQSHYVSVELDKIKFRNSFLNYYQNMRDFIRNVDVNFGKGCIKLEHGLNFQKTQFLEKLRIKKFKFFLKSDSKVNDRHKSFTKPWNEEFVCNSAILKDKRKAFGTISYKKKLLFNDDEDIENKENGENIMTSNNIKRLKCEKKSSKITNKQKKKHIGNIIENFLSNLQITFIHNICDPELKNIISSINENYRRKKENFLDYYNSRAEIEIMLLDNPSKYILTYLRLDI
jgi:hypothetical protein